MKALLQKLPGPSKVSRIPGPKVSNVWALKLTTCLGHGRVHHVGIVLSLLHRFAWLKYGEKLIIKSANVLTETNEIPCIHTSTSTLKKKEKKQRINHTSWCSFFKRTGLGNKISKIWQQGLVAAVEAGKRTWKMLGIKVEACHWMKVLLLVGYAKNQTCSIFGSTKCWFWPSSSIGVRSIYIYIYHHRSVK